MKKISIVLECIFQISAFTIIPILVFSLLTFQTNLAGGVRSFVVVSGSMQPLIPVGSLVFVEKSNKFKVGDIITFNRDDKVVTHRIVGVQNGEYQVKGDANSAPDSQLVPPATILGKAYIHLPQVGYFIGFVKSLPGFLLLVILPNTIFIGFELWNIKKEIEKEVEKKMLKQFYKKNALYEFSK